MAGYELDSVDLNVDIASEASISANVANAQPYAVTLGKAAEIDAGQAITYIESGKAEVRKAVVEQVEIATTAATNAADSATNAENSAISAAADADRAEAAAQSIVSDKTFVFEQGEASDTWAIEHNLGKFPSVEIVDTAGNRFFPAVQWVDENNCIATMNGACKGKAFLN